MKRPLLALGLTLVSIYYCLGSTILPVLAASPYTSETGHFSITPPAGWELIPDEVISQYKEALREQGASAAVIAQMDYEVGYQAPSSDWFTYPYMFVSYKPGRLTEYDFRGNYDATFQSGLDRAQEGSGGLITDTSAGKSSYDADRKISYTTLDATLADGSVITSLSAIHLGGSGVAVVYMYSTKAAYNSYKDKFVKTNESLAWESGYEFNPSVFDSASGEVAGNVLEGAIRGALLFGVFGVGGLLVGLFSRKKKKSVDTAADKPENNGTDPSP